jgi:catechol 2,3-dioxygenase-like lactoylglutathione lyase family enzyme
MELGCQRAWVTVAAQNFDRSCRFYQQLLDQPPQSVISDHYAEFDIANLRIGIYRSRTEPPGAIALPFPAVSLCLEVENLAGAIAHLTHLGYPPPGNIIVAPHGQEIYAYDPDGNRLILYEKA